MPNTSHNGTVQQTRFYQWCRTVHWRVAQTVTHHSIRLPNQLLVTSRTSSTSSSPPTPQSYKKTMLHCRTAQTSMLLSILAFKIKCHQNLVTFRKHYTAHVVVWHSGSSSVSINKVNLRWAQLVLGWATVSRFNAWYRTIISVTSHQGQLSLAIPLWVGATSASQRVVTPCGWGVKAGIVIIHVCVAVKIVWSPC